MSGFRARKQSLLGELGVPAPTRRSRIGSGAEGIAVRARKQSLLGGGA